MQERPHLAGTKCEVQADTEWLAMADAHVECLRGLARERAAGLIDDGTGDEDWHFVDEVHLLKQFVDRIDGCLRVQGVENGLDGQAVASTVKKTTSLLLVRFGEQIGRAHV